MLATSRTTFTHDRALSAVDGATLQRTRWWETAYTSVSWDYPPSPAAYYDALLARGASYSRFLRMAYLSTRERSLSPTSTASPLDTSATPTSHLASTTPSTFPAGPSREPAVHLPPILSRPCMNLRPRSANPTSHASKRRKPQWPKPPHYHASLLRSPLSRRKGLFRAVLPPNKAVDFFRWDVLVGAGVSLSVPRQARHRTRSWDVDACASVHVAESVLGPYEAAAGFFGWHGVGLDVVRCVEGNDDEGVDDEGCWSEGVEACQPGLGDEGAEKSGSSDLQLEIDEAEVEKGRARWACAAEELVGPPGVALRWVIEDDKSERVTAPRREEVRWDLDTGSSSSRSSRPTSTSDEKRPTPPSSSMAGSASSSKPELTSDSPPAWWCGPSPYRGPPPTTHLPSLRLPPLPSLQYGLPPLQFSPWFPGGRVASAQGHGYWYGPPPIGAPSPMSHDPNLAKSFPPHSHVFAAPATPTSIHPAHSPRYPTKSSSGRDEYGPGQDYDKDETDHGYESTTTTTDSDPPPHTPIGAATTPHPVEALQVHGDDDVEVHGVEIDADHAAACVAIGPSDPTTPVKHLGRFSVSTSPSVSSGSPGSNRDVYESPKAAVVFPSLNGSFRQGSLSQMSVSLSSQEVSTQTTPVRTVTPLSSSSFSSAKESTTRLGLGDEGHSKTKLGNGGLEPSTCSVSGDSPAFMLSPCSPTPTNSSPGLRKDSQGFWEPVMPISPSSSSSSLPLSPSEGKTGSRPTAGWIGEKIAPVPGEIFESCEAASSQFTPSAKSRSLSPGPCGVTSTGSTRSSSSRPASFSSPTSTPASASVFGGSYPPSPSPPNGSSLVPTTLLPAFLATTSVKRKKASRTREIVDRLRSSSIDAGKGGVGLDSLGWLAGPSAGRELDGTLGNASSGSDHAAGNHVGTGQPSPSTPSKSSADAGSWLGSDLGKNHGHSKTPESGSSGPGGKNNGPTQAAVLGPETLFSLANSRGVTTTANTSVTPFPILSVSQTSASNFTMNHQNQPSGTTGREPVTATPSNCGDGSKMHATAATSPSARSSSSQLLPSTPNGSTSASKHPSHHPLPSPSHPAAHPPAPLGPPMLAVSPFPHPMYVSFPQYHIAPPHQGQQGQPGTWLAVYPGRPPHLPVHPLSAQAHVASITGASGMRHASW